MTEEREWDLCRFIWEQYAQHLPDEQTPVGRVRDQQAICRRAIEIWEQQDTTLHFVPPDYADQGLYRRYALSKLYYALGQIDYMRGCPDDGLHQALGALSHEKHYGPPGTINRRPLSFGRPSFCWNGVTNPVQHRG
jgi:hypothetical protein